MNTIKKLYKEFFGLNGETNTIPKIGDADIEQLKKYNDALEQIKQTMSEEENIDEAQLVNHIHDYRGGVEYVLRDASQAKEVAAQIQDWTTKKGFTVIKHTISKSGKIGYFYFRLGEDPEREAQRIQGYFSSKIEIKFFRFKVKEKQTPQRTIAQSKI